MMTRIEFLLAPPPASTLQPSPVLAIAFTGVPRPQAGRIKPRDQRIHQLLHAAAQRRKDRSAVRRFVLFGRRFFVMALILLVRGQHAARERAVLASPSPPGAAARFARSVARRRRHRCR